MAHPGDELLAFVEIPKGSRNKYEYDEELGALILDRFLSSSTVYPTDYGYLIGHRGRDGDPLDAMVCVSEPTFPGCVIPVKPIALFKMHDEKGEDDKIVCVPINDPGWNHAETLEDIPEQLQREITHFFSIYKQLEGKEVDGRGLALARGGARGDRGRQAPAGAGPTAKADRLPRHICPPRCRAATKLQEVRHSAGSRTRRLHRRAGRHAVARVLRSAPW